MTDFPTREQILDFVAKHGHKTGKREIARAFNIKGADRIALKRLLRELAAEGLLESDRRSGFYPADALPPVCVLKITHRDAEGVLCAALQRGGEVQTDADAPRITIDEGATGMSRKRGGRITRAHIGDIVLARLREVSPQNYNARVMRRIGGDAEQERRIIGVARERGGQFVLLPADKRDRRDYHIAEAGTVRDGDVVNAKLLASPNNAYRRAPKRVSIESVIGRTDDPTVFSHIALAEQAIRTQFPESVAQEAANASPPDFTTRTDLTHLPFVTIDPADARDHDDAVCALPDPDRAGGYIVWVAIADVAAYVRPNSAMDNEARARGNSTYLPDRVVPMYYVDILERQVNIVMSPSHVTIGSLLAHIRMGDVSAVHSLRRGAAEAIETALHGDSETSPIIGREAQEVKWPEGVVPGAIIRENETLIVHDDTVFCDGDRLICFVSGYESVKKMEKLMQVNIKYF